MTGQYDNCPTCGRKVLEEGTVNRMEAALDRDGRHPVLDHLDKWMNSPRERRKKNLADLIMLLSDFANEPESLTDKQLKYLRNEIWELKCGRLRILFGGGTCVESEVLRRSKYSLTLPKEVKQVPSHVNCGRATNAFPKGTVSTPRGQIDLAIGISREDQLR